jgi:hypothetical protein
MLLYLNSFRVASRAAQKAAVQAIESANNPFFSADIFCLFGPLTCQ